MYPIPAMVQYKPPYPYQRLFNRGRYGMRFVKYRLKMFKAFRSGSVGPGWRRDLFLEYSQWGSQIHLAQMEKKWNSPSWSRKHSVLVPDSSNGLLSTSEICRMDSIRCQAAGQLPALLYSYGDALPVLRGP